ncbi:hypothetical protein LZ31DRAFT_588081 [Colletotrichum somersetense]|nr:hypothetical protein LZ31DRAFT_588081 [Colletotrichum somersetense]
MAFAWLVGLLGLLGVARCQSVFAHFMITNSANYSANDWVDDTSAAQRAHIDAFALNMAYGDATNEKSVAAAFEHASGLGFHLFFSFDYAGNGPWPKNDVESFIRRYAGSGAYFHYQGKPFVSTFEGPDQAEDWIDIKAATGCFFIPDWSSLGAKPAMAKAGGPYMMPASPWFYTNLPGYDKNWMWRGDSLWFDRWQEILWWRPEFVEIISWNDYGESHYIGPVRDIALEAFVIGKAPFNYALPCPHDGWRETLPFSIDMYKYNTTTVNLERLVVWYRPNPSTSCNSGGTSGNTASQLQLEFHPWNVAKDAVYFTALLTSPATIEVFVGGVKQKASWSATPEGGVGLYHGNAWYYDSTGDVHVRVVRGGTVVAEVAGIPITGDCSATKGYTNWNAWVGSAVSANAVSAKPNSRTDQVCVEGTGPLPDFARLCEFTCGYGYCPQGACHCTKLGARVERPKWKGINAFPAAGRTSDYQGLCQNACNWGFCPSAYCDTTQHPTVIATVSQFLPGACTRGEMASSADPYFADLCSFSCAHGFCPIAVCYCLAQGALNLLEPTSSSDARTVDGAPEDHGLCAFACARGHCPGMCASGDETDLWKAGYYVPEYDAAEDELYPSAMASFAACDPDARPTTLDELLDGISKGSYNPACYDRWALRILSDLLDNFQSDYQDALRDYDDLFGYYAEYVEGTINPQLMAYMDLDGGPGNRFFTCSWKIASKTKSGPCPPSEQFWKLGESWKIDYKLIDADGFYEAVERDLGIEKDWISFGEWHQTTDSECIDAPDWRPHGPKTPCRKMQLYKTGIPVKSGTVKVPDPKDVIEAAMPNIELLSTRLLSAYAIVVMGYADDPGDIITAAAMPVFMLEGVIESMKQIKKIGAEQQALDKKSLVLEILSIILALLPIAGELVSAAFGGAAIVARMALLIGEIGNAALTIEGIVEDPVSAPFAIMGPLVGPFGGSSRRTSAQGFRAAAAARKALTAEKLTLFGNRFVKQDARVQKIVNACR